MPQSRGEHTVVRVSLLAIIGQLMAVDGVWPCLSRPPNGWVDNLLADTFSAGAVTSEWLCFGRLAASAELPIGVRLGCGDRQLTRATGRFALNTEPLRIRTDRSDKAEVLNQTA